MKNMIDMHSHLLHEIDDGAKNIDAALKLIKIYSDNGFKAVVCTPHYIKGNKFSTSVENIAKRINELNEVIAESETDIKLYPGMEIKLDDETVAELEKGVAISLNNSRYVLVELSNSSVNYYNNKILLSLQNKGYIPIIAHAERNPNIIEDISVAKGFVNRGMLIQVNKGSLVGDFGKKSKKVCIKLLKQGLVHFVGTDTHNETIRSPKMKKAIRKLKKIVGAKNTELLLNKNPSAIIEDKDVSNMIKYNSTLRLFLKIGIICIISLTILAGSAFYLLNRTVEKIFDSLMTEEFLTEIESIMKEDFDLSDDIKLKMESALAEELLDEGTKSNIINVDDAIKDKGMQEQNTEKEDGHSEDVQQEDAQDKSAQQEDVQDKPAQQEDLQDKSEQQEDAQDKSAQQKDLQNKDTQYKDVKENQNEVTQVIDEFIQDENQSIDENKVETIKPFTSADKARVIRIIYDTIPENKISQMKQMVAEGISSEDIEEAKRIVRENMNSSQIDELKELYVRYVITNS